MFTHGPRFPALIVKVAVALLGPGNKVVIPAQFGSGIRVVGAFLVADDATNVTFRSGSVAISGQIKMKSGEQINLQYQQVGHLDTAISQALVMSLAGNKAGLNGWLHWMPI